MPIKPQYTKYVPLFEEHKAINERFAALPEQIRQDLSAVLALDEEAVICGQLGMYLLGNSKRIPECVDIIVKDASRLRPTEQGFENCYPDMEQPGAEAVMEPEVAQPQPVGDGSPTDDAGTQVTDGETAQGSQEQKPAEGEIVIMTILPDGKIDSMEKPKDDVPEGWYDDQGAFHFEGFKWVRGRPEGVTGSVCVFEASGRIKTMPMALGNLTVLVEEPGVMSEYRKKFTKGPNVKVKYEKLAGFDKKKQTNVIKDSKLACSTGPKGPNSPHCE